MAKHGKAQKLRGKRYLCELIVLLDRSGSMSSCAHLMERAFDAFIQDQQAVVYGQLKVTLVRFDDSRDVVYESKPVTQVPRLQLQARGNSPIFAAIGDTIVEQASRLDALPDPPGKVLFLLITDGEAGSSSWTADQVKEAVADYTNAGWSFAYLGAGVNVNAEIAKMGISPLGAVGFQANEKGIEGAFAMTSRSLASYRGAPVGAVYSAITDAALKETE